MNEHTILKLHPPDVIRFGGDTLTWHILGADGLSIIMDEDMARFIVTACNCHANLLKACRTAFDYLADSYEESEAFKISKVLERAIRNAEEQA